MWEVTLGSVCSNGVLQVGSGLFLSPSTSCEKLGVSGSSACEVEALSKNSFGPMLGCTVEVEVEADVILMRS